jgi:outer membrane protein OmpA-like peptidoglycan-associated protein
VISPDSQDAISATAATLNQHPEISLVEVQGHADERGDDARNVELTRARAQAVVEALVVKGVARQRLHAAGYGSRCPADAACQRSDAPASCHDPSRYQDDRRVVFLPLKLGSSAYKGEIACARGAALIPAADAVFHAPGAH